MPTQPAAENGALPPAHAALVLALSIAGCVATPDVSEPRLPSREAALRSMAAVIAREPALDESQAPSEWWLLFGDATLTALQAEAASSNLDLQVAIARIEESRAQLGLVDAARSPQLAGGAGYTRSALSEHSPWARLGAPTSGSSTWQLGLQAGWELDLGGRLRQLSESAGANLEATGYGMASVKVSVAGDVARTYLLIRGVQAQMTIVEENRQIAENLVRLAESRQRHGVASRFDAAAASADVAGIEARLSQLRQQRDVLMNALALLLGKPPRDLDARLAQAALPAMPKRLPIGVPSELARTRPDIRQAEARLRAAVADIGAAEADFYPRISLTGGLGLQAFQLSDLGSWSSRWYSIGPTLYLPIFQGGRLESSLALSEARHRVAGIAYQQTVLRAWGEVDDALNAYSIELKRHAQLQVAFAQTQTALDVAQRAYQQGTVDFTSVLVARRSLLASQSELTHSATASALSVVSLYRSLGGGWSAQMRAGTTSAGDVS
ncbi:MULTISPECIES: TolC family protein [unclassified Variovorax]|uniref:efflux transporter outer membrane subunit n=1 Tax=unclassified Variovorax TaxID=663243 RepID=UPI00076C632B|nr:MULTISPECIES: TolC family protein [unclassified Variovorax]KWT94132.1 Outer membrane component of tripartite multidrug resistance system [Variovorax sp. WDL1]PNG59909.1 Toluene efflux pump outer membrane protein TtgI [Variovorax sp. B4]PNG60300.1 Toluene efflux pump outer membrane protein TtgI [Variovorax sp. B2]VTV13853.1 Toluene efflux pump outer membrane protein TtgI precursor [Variovorax sp. WDL1]